MFDASPLSISRTLGLDADRLMTVEVMPRFEDPLRRAIDGEFNGCPLDIWMRVWLPAVSRDAGATGFWVPSLTGNETCGSMTGSPAGAGIQCSHANCALTSLTMR